MGTGRVVRHWRLAEIETPNGTRSVEADAGMLLQFEPDERHSVTGDRPAASGLSAS